jgi:outer membrane protein assembly factor BamA
VADLPFLGGGTRSEVELLASGAEFERFYGLGNETTDDGPRESFRARRQEFSVAGSVGWSPEPGFRLDGGVRFRALRPDHEAGTVVELQQPYGHSDLDVVALETRITIDRADRPSAPRTGYGLQLEGRWMPEVMDVRSSYGSVSGTATAYLSSDRSPFEPGLALRFGGERLFGDFPFFDAAHLGGAETLRGFRSRRFAGRGSLLGAAELRVRLTDFIFLLPGELGLLTHGDAGRVFADGEDSGRVHTSVGGGVWIDFVEAYSGHVTLSRSTEGTLVYIGLGLPF